MSQDKVNRHKEERANRKKQMLKKKKMKPLKIFGAIISTVALIALIIVSSMYLHGDFKEEETSTYSAEQMSALQDYISSLSTTDSSETSATDESTTTSEETTTVTTEETSAE